MIITALDFNNPKAAIEFADQIDPALSRLKVGKELFTVAGPALVEALQKKGFDVFLDLKFHDIPNTVAGALSAAASLGVWMVDVHACGGPRMLEAARKAVTPAGATGGTRLIAVTVLTSMDKSELSAIGIDKTPQQQVATLAQLTIDQGLDGVVCSPQEVALINGLTSDSFLTVTPGVRPASANIKADDQRRVMTPSEAIAAGSSYLVIGRPITQSDNPLQTLKDIHAQISEPTS